MSAFKSFLFMAACCVLHGCAAVPGQHMSAASAQTVGGMPVEIRPITVDLLAEQSRAPEREPIPSELLAYRPESYRIGPGDILYVTVWDHPELTSPASTQQPSANGRLVRPDGTLFYPYVGVLKVAGLTVEELRANIAAKLRGYIAQPQVDVAVVGYASQRVFVQGAFEKTGPQPVTTVPLTLAQALGTAGIRADQAYLAGFVLERDGQRHVLDLDDGNGPAADIFLKPGDHLFLPYNDRHEAYVLGEVNRPMAINFRAAHLTLTQVLGRAGGLNGTTSKGKAVYVVRGSEQLTQAPAQVFQLDARSPAAFALARQFKVRPGDVVFVGPAGVTRWNRLVSQLLPLSGVISNAASAQYSLER